jgi:ubiquinone biosynthesis protein COQ4
MAILEIMRYFPEFIKILRKGDYTGDAVILKSLFGKFEPSPKVASLIEGISHSPPDFSDIDFMSMPTGSFGWSYGHFMMQQNLKPFRFSGKYKDLMVRNYLPIFYASVHDFFHVLTGYDTSLAGEAGVWGFVAGQEISPQAKGAYNLTQLLYPIVNPRQRQLIRRAGTEGFQNGQKAHLVLSIDFRAEFPRPLSEIRSKYNIVPTGIITAGKNAPAVNLQNL